MIHVQVVYMIIQRPFRARAVCIGIPGASLRSPLAILGRRFATPVRPPGAVWRR